MHQGITRPDESQKARPFIMFVDDNLMVDTPYRIKQCMAASLETLFRVMDFDCPSLRRSNISMDKYFQLTVSHYQTQLGLDVDTRKMIVSLLDSKKTPLINLLSHWHTHRKSFVIKEASSLLGKLNFAAEVAS